MTYRHRKPRSANKIPDKIKWNRLQDADDLIGEQTSEDIFEQIETINDNVWSVIFGITFNIKTHLREKNAGW